LRQRGSRSKTTLHKALRELLDSGLIVQTRQGSLHKCSLFALGWLAIDECGGKLEIKATARPLNYWLDPIKPIEINAPSPQRVPKWAFFMVCSVHPLYTSIDLPFLVQELSANH
jgi:hypothetical protein